MIEHYVEYSVCFNTGHFRSDFPAEQQKIEIVLSWKVLKETFSPGQERK